MRFTKATLRQANIPEHKGQSLGTIRSADLRERSPYGMKFEDRSQEETERQERCMAKSILKLNEKDKLLLFDLPEALVSPSAIRNKTGGTRIRCRFRSVIARAEQERSEFIRIGNLEGL